AKLSVSRRDNAVSDCFRRLCGPASHQVLVWDRRHIYLNVDAVHQWSGDLRHVPLNLRRRAVTLPTKIVCKAARAGLRCLFAVELKGLKPKPYGYPNELNTLGDEIRKVRLERGLLQRDVARVIGVSVQSVVGWETNRRQPAVVHIPGIVRFL